MSRPELQLHRGLWTRPGTTDAKIIEEVIVRKTYERPRLGFVPEPGEVWADLGANIGAFSALYAGVVDKIYAYEPDPDTYHVLELNMEPHDNVVLVPMAVADYTGTATFTRREVMNSRNTLYRAGRWAHRKDVVETEVLVMSGADLPADVTCVKADIEGAEKPLLDVLPFERIDKLVLEWSWDIWPEFADFNRAMALLRGIYPNVRPTKTYPESGSWPSSWYPPCTNVFAWK